MSTQSLPMYFPSAFSLDTAVTCGSLVLSAYDQFKQWSAAGFPSQSDFKWTPDLDGFTFGAPLWANFVALYISHWEPVGFLAWDGNGNAYVVFRGTMTRADAYIDAELAQTSYDLVPSFGNVQEGWYKAYLTVREAMLTQIGQLTNLTTLTFTGHSMGSAFSTLAAADAGHNSATWNATNTSYLHYNFASPRVGDPTFSNAMDFVSGIPTYRIVNTEDLVPDVPTPTSDSGTFYEHIGTPIDFTGQYLSVDGNHSMADCYWYAINHPDQPQGPVSSSLARVIRQDGLQRSRR
jgi:triacylglycerol lipase